MKATICGDFHPDINFLLQYAILCAILTVVLSAVPRQAVFPPLSVFHRGVNFFLLPPIDKREGVADMIVTWSDLIQFGILIFAILAYAESKKK